MRCHAWHFDIVLSTLLVSSSSWAQTSGTLAVQVTAPGGSGAGLVVVASLSVPDTAAGFSGQRVFASLTDATGKLLFSALPFGIYSVCIEPINRPFIDPCSWSPPDTTHLTSQHPSDTMNLPLAKGIPVDIRIDDPQGLLSSPSAGYGVMVGVVTPAGRVHLRPAAQDFSGINYRIIAPQSIAASIQVSAGALRIVDATGTAVNFSSTASAPSFNLSATDTGKFFRYAIRKSQ